MIKKDLFVKCLNNYKAYNDWEHELYKLGINFWEREEIQNLLNSYIELLEYCCKDIPNDKYDSSNISYFIYDVEFGKNADEYFITLDTGDEIKFNTVDDLWDYLVSLHPEINDTDISKDKTEKSEAKYSGNLSESDLFDIFMENFSK